MSWFLTVSRSASAVADVNVNIRPPAGRSSLKTSLSEILLAPAFEASMSIDELSLHDDVRTICGQDGAYS
jgi:hypothetical protein